MKDGKHAIGLRDDKITLFAIDSAKVLGTIDEENEHAITFALSPNQQVLAVATKSYAVKAYRLPAEIPEFGSKQEAWKPELFQSFRLVGSLALELCFDPSSRYVAAGTSDS